jgi:tetratricopeptide (TPR) repeat protein
MFGFGFNKAKVFSSAEKFVKQGKLHNAIAEYEKIAKEDPKDLTILNTIGDLYARIGATEKATDCFRRIGESYATDGFTVKAIAMYKKLTKQDPQASGALMKLAELYTQQGLYNDARQQYTLVSEQYLRAGELEKATNVLQRMVEIDPESTPLLARLGELYGKLGRSAEARDTYFRCAEAFRSKGSLDAADDALSHVLSLDPAFNKALLLRGLVRLDSDDPEGAIKSLEQVADLDSRPDGLRAMLKSLLKVRRLQEADPIARKLVTMFNDPAGIMAYVEGLITAGSCDLAIRVFGDFSDRMLAWNSSAVLNALHSMIAKVRGDARSLEAVCELFQKADDSTHLTEVTELLAHAYVQSGELARASDLYKRLAQMEPSNKLHLKQYQQLLERLGETKNRGAVANDDAASLALEGIDEVPPPLPGVAYSAEISEEIKAAITEADLYEGYNVPSRAIVPLESVSRTVPNDPEVNYKLARIYARMGRFEEAASRCEVVSSAYASAGCEKEASHFASIARAYRGQHNGPLPSGDQELRGIRPAPETDDDTMPNYLGAAESAPSVVPGENERLFFDLDLQEQDPVPPGSENRSGVGILPTPFPEIASDTGPVVESRKLDQDQEPVLEAKIPASTPVPSLSSNEVTSSAVQSFAVGQPVDSQLSQEKSGAPAHELDLSSEWDELFTTDIQHPAESHAEEGDLPSAGEKAPLTSSDTRSIAFGPGSAASEAGLSIADVLDEASFYLSQFMLAEAESAIARCEAAQPGLPQIAELRSELELLKAKGEHEREIPDLEVLSSFQNGLTGSEFKDMESGLTGSDSLTASEGTDAKPMYDLAAAESIIDVPAFAQPAAQVAPAPAMGLGLDALATDLELVAGDDFDPKPRGNGQAVTAARPEAVPSSSASISSSGTGSPVTAPPIPPLANAALASTQPEDALAGSPATAVLVTDERSASSTVATAETSTTAATPADDLNFALSDIFAEFKRDMEETEQVETPDDIDTHYNLGVAFREMGLMDEAIGEMQKVCQAIERGASFPRAMQAFTWLADSFVQKGVPEAGIRWYEKALKLPEIDDDTRVAIHYELGCAYEIAGNKQAALTHFMEVYGSNIDYRDIAVRIKRLKS